MAYYNYRLERELGLSTELNPLFDAIPNETLFSPSQVAELLNKSNETVRRWCRQEKLKSYCQGGYIIVGNDLKDFLQRSKPKSEKKKVWLS
ncbi:helix-turn-helix domain-containing protein [Paenibacillus sp. BC26]|uniref:helix-turn-helix domain-containing protein n=1 Tax=Paenibacillus sp. BC26 TaxID=1881032 RepID=UPI0015A73257|nr:helix-turn-helix domain-containing protein [Paenibacillus sp. BC26]